MIQRLASYAGSLVLHVDATYGVNDRDFPVIILGFSDMNGSFHIIATVISSHEKSFVFRQTFEKVNAIHYFLAGRPIRPAAVLSDGARAIFDAVAAVFPGVVHLMCTFHLKQAINNKFTTLQSRQMASGDIESLIMTSSVPEFESRLASISQTWNSLGFGLQYSYLLQYWVNSAQSKWRVFDAFPGCPRTNNCLESFNGNFKRVFFQRKTFKMSVCLDKMIAAVLSLSSNPSIVAESRTIDSKWLNAARRASSSFTILDNQVQDGEQRSFIIGADHMRCFCPYFLKDGKCFHLYAYCNANDELHLLGLEGNSTLVRRGRRGRPRSR